MTRSILRRHLLSKAGLAVLAVALSGCGLYGAGKNETTTKPNIIFILTDDQGWADTSVPMMKDRPDSRSDFYQTPNLERMARQGMVFSNAYAPSPVCTPTRTSLQFGKSPARLRYTVVHDVLAKQNGYDCRDEITLGQMIKNVDPTYATAHFGKWGIDVLRTPGQDGYDATDGNTNNGEGDWLVHRKTVLPPDDPKRIFSVTRRANDFMAEQVKAQSPFFMQVSHYAVHTSPSALKKTIDKYRKMGHTKSKAVYAAMIENLDTSLGQLLDKVEELGIKDNTYLVFTSDNGGGSKNHPLKGGKASLWEGGLRVPTVVMGPKVLQNSHCDVPVVGWDFYPTFRELAGSKTPLPPDYDGGSLCELFTKGNNGKVKRGTKELIFHYPWYAGFPMSTIRDGDFKLAMNLLNKETRLYNLDDDIGEANDISQKFPDVAARLHKRLTDYLNEVEAEDIEDMYAARVKELHRYMERSAGDEEALKRHRHGLEQVADSRKRTW
jgi:arylsulfatase A-like enzyme